MERISSRTNPVVKQFRAAAGDPGDTLLLDGEHLVEEAIASGVRLHLIALPERQAGGGAGALARRAAEAGARILLVTDGVLAAISPLRQPSGPVALAARPAASLDEVFGRAPQLVLLLAGVQDPGNVGAIVRAADACGATGIVAGEGCADAFGWKALRGAMGSTFHLPVATRVPLARAVEMARRWGLQIAAAVPRSGTPLPRADLRRPSAILLGGEGAGLAEALIALADTRLAIPMSRRVESLNVATAAAIVTYEAMRQREGAPS